MDTAFLFRESQRAAIIESLSTQRTPCEVLHLYGRSQSGKTSCMLHLLQTLNIPFSYFDCGASTCLADPLAFLQTLLQDLFTLFPTIDSLNPAHESGGQKTMHPVLEIVSHYLANQASSLSFTPGVNTALHTTDQSHFPSILGPLYTPPAGALIQGDANLDLQSSEFVSDPCRNIPSTLVQILTTSSTIAQYTPHPSTDGTGYVLVLDSADILIESLITLASTSTSFCQLISTMLPNIAMFDAFTSGETNQTQSSLAARQNMIAKVFGALHQHAMVLPAVLQILLTMSGLHVALIFITKTPPRPYLPLTSIFHGIRWKHILFPSFTAAQQLALISRFAFPPWLLPSIPSHLCSSELVQDGELSSGQKWQSPYARLDSHLDSVQSALTTPLQQPNDIICNYSALPFQANVHALHNLLTSSMTFSSLPRVLGIFHPNMSIHIPLGPLLQTVFTLLFSPTFISTYKSHSFSQQFCDGVLTDSSSHISQSLTPTTTTTTTTTKRTPRGSATNTSLTSETPVKPILSLLYTFCCSFSSICPNLHSIAANVVTSCPSLENYHNYRSPSSQVSTGELAEQQSSVLSLVLTHRDSIATPCHQLSLQPQLNHLFTPYNFPFGPLSYPFPVTSATSHDLTVSDTNSLIPQEQQQLGLSIWQQLNSSHEHFDENSNAPASLSQQSLALPLLQILPINLLTHILAQDTVNHPNRPFSCLGELYQQCFCRCYLAAFATLAHSLAWLIYQVSTLRHVIIMSLIDKWVQTYPVVCDLVFPEESEQDLKSQQPVSPPTVRRRRRTAVTENTLLSPQTSSSKGTTKNSRGPAADSSSTNDEFVQLDPINPLQSTDQSLQQFPQNNSTSLPQSMAFSYDDVLSQLEDIIDPSSSSLSSSSSSFPSTTTSLNPSPLSSSSHSHQRHHRSSVLPPFVSPFFFCSSDQPNRPQSPLSFLNLVHFARFAYLSAFPLASLLRQYQHRHTNAQIAARTTFQANIATPSSTAAAAAAAAAAFPEDTTHPDPMSYLPPGQAIVSNLPFETSSTLGSTSFATLPSSQYSLLRSILSNCSLESDTNETSSTSPSSSTGSYLIQRTSAAYHAPLPSVSINDHYYNTINDASSLANTSISLSSLSVTSSTHIIALAYLYAIAPSSSNFVLPMMSQIVSLSPQQLPSSLLLTSMTTSTTMSSSSSSSSLSQYTVSSALSVPFTISHLHAAILCAAFLASHILPKFDAIAFLDVSPSHLSSSVRNMTKSHSKAKRQQFATTSTSPFSMLRLTPHFARNCPMDRLLSIIKFVCSNATLMGLSEQYFHVHVTMQLQTRQLTQSLYDALDKTTFESQQYNLSRQGKANKQKLLRQIANQKSELDTTWNWYQLDTICQVLAQLASLTRYVQIRAARAPYSVAQHEVQGLVDLRTAFLCADFIGFRMVELMPFLLQTPTNQAQVDI